MLHRLHSDDCTVYSLVSETSRIIKMSMSTSNQYWHQSRPDTSSMRPDATLPAVYHLGTSKMTGLTASTRSQRHSNQIRN